MVKIAVGKAAEIPVALLTLLRRAFEKGQRPASTDPDLVADLSIGVVGGGNLITGRARIIAGLGGREA
jgi:hypothetical protein